MTFCNDLIGSIAAQLPEIHDLRRNRREKTDRSYVTDADLLIQDIVADFSSASLPTHTLISEEQDNSGIDYARQNSFIVVDPLDGTENFASGLKEWGVGISVYTDYVHQESAIFLPDLDEVLITGQKTEIFNSRIHGLSSSLQKKDLNYIEDGFEYRIMGCSMYNMFNAIRGSYRLFENVKGVNAWDILPGINLALEHGCEVHVNSEKYDGRFLRPDQKYRVKVRQR